MASCLPANVLKIAKFEDFHVDCGWEDYSFLKITTDEGLVGWSEFRESRRKGMRALIHGMSELLIGADPRAIGRLDASLYAHVRTVPGGPGTAALRDVTETIRVRPGRSPAGRHVSGPLPAGDRLVRRAARPEGETTMPAAAATGS